MSARGRRNHFTPRAESGYPGRPRLSRADELRVLSDGPALHWFQPWAELGVLVPSVTERKFRFGYVHVLGAKGAPPRYDVHLFWDREGLSWDLENLHRNHPRCGDDCQGLFYFQPDEPVRLRMVIETDDDEDDSEDDDEQLGAAK